MSMMMLVGWFEWTHISPSVETWVVTDAAMVWPVV
jgi:hypothetical protein